MKATADAALKGKIYSVCSMPDLSERNVGDGDEIKSTSPLGGIQQAGGPETTAKSVTPCFAFGSDYKHVHISLYFIITNFHTELKKLR